MAQIAQVGVPGTEEVWFMATPVAKAFQLDRIYHKFFAMVIDFLLHIAARRGFIVLRTLELVSVPGLFPGRRLAIEPPDAKNGYSLVTQQVAPAVTTVADFSPNFANGSSNPLDVPGLRLTRPAPSRSS
jgi:hypothetical protein